jgi:hypothetical protein
MMTKIDGTGANATGPTGLKWHVVEGSATDLSTISLDYSNATVIRSSKAVDADDMQKSISKVSFSVKDDEGKTAIYNDVDAGSDFASLSL